MNTTAQRVLHSFEQLPQSEKSEVAFEILRQTAGFDFPPLSDDELTAQAEELFLELDKRETKNGAA